MLARRAAALWFKGSKGAIGAYWVLQLFIMAKQRKKYLLVDGYNVIRSGTRYRDIVGPDYTHEAFNRAREALIKDVGSYANANFTDATIVFDGAQNCSSTGEPQRVGGVRIVFSPAGVSADHIIEKMAHEYRERELECIVVTSDASIQDATFGGGIDRMSANGFSREMVMHYEDAHLDELPMVAEKRTVMGRIDASTVAKLKALRDSL